MPHCSVCGVPAAIGFAQIAGVPLQAGPRVGVDLEQAVEVVGASSGASWIFSDRMPRALAGDYAPRAAARVLLKDIGLFRSDIDAAESLPLGRDPIALLASRRTARSNARSANRYR